jgi:hypothetical protein
MTASGGGAIQKKKVTILNGQSLSDEADLTGWRLAAIQMPAGWDAASITFQARPGKQSQDTAALSGEALQNVFDDGGTEVSLTVAAARYVTLTGVKLDALLGVGAVKLRSGANAAPVNQTADRVIWLTLLPIT